ncbi:MAG: sensor histidine kinase [Caldilineae bacterium]|nr:MAG: sensor histidine kinase [Caldilineae bacterium]
MYSWEDKYSQPPIQRFRLSRWLQERGLNLERQLQLIQWLFPLTLTAIVLLDEVREHLLEKQETIFSENFIIEVAFFGILGPTAVWLVLYWVRGVWQEREDDRRLLQKMYNELAEAQERLTTLHIQRGKLVDRLMTVQEDERRRLAREIHDELGQLLTGLSLNLKVCQEAVPKELEAVHQHMARINTLIRHTIDQTHHLIVGLRPTVLDDYGLLPALQEELHHRLDPLDIDVHLETNGSFEHLPPAVTTAVFRIVQESVTNIIRHANAHHVRLTLACSTEELRVTVEDDGVGIPKPQPLNGDNRHRLGILGMQERAAALGGRVEVSRRQPRGTQVQVWFPLQVKTEAA